ARNLPHRDSQRLTVIHLDVRPSRCHSHGLMKVSRHNPALVSSGALVRTEVARRGSPPSARAPGDLELDHVHDVFGKRIEGDALGKKVIPFTNSRASWCKDSMASSAQRIGYTPPAPSTMPSAVHEHIGLGHDLLLSRVRFPPTGQQARATETLSYSRPSADLRATHDDPAACGDLLNQAIREAVTIKIG